jgi:hypothetical protein
MLTRWVRGALAKLLGKGDYDALGPADVSKPVCVIISHFANEFRSVGTHSRNDRVYVIDGKHDATEAQCVHWCVHGSKSDRLGRVELVELNALSVGSPHHRQGGADVWKPDQLSDQRAFDYRLSLELKSQCDEERLGGLEIVDDEEDVVHPLD